MSKFTFPLHRGDRHNPGPPKNHRLARAKRIREQAAYSALMGLTSISAGIAAGAWSASAWMTAPSGGAVVGAIALASLTLGLQLIRDGWRLRMIADREERAEWMRHQL